MVVNLIGREGSGGAPTGRGGPAVRREDAERFVALPRELDTKLKKPPLVPVTGPVPASPSSPPGWPAWPAICCTSRRTRRGWRNVGGDAGCGSAACSALASVARQAI